MINLKVNYEFETRAASRRRCFKYVFERYVECVYDFDYDAPYAEAYIEIASRFGFDADDEAREILWMKIEEEHEADMDYMLLIRAMEYIEEGNLVCYKVGKCSRNGITFDGEKLFCYSDSGLLYCILKSSGDEEFDKTKARNIAAYLAEIRDDVVADEEPIMIEKEEYDI